jgi:ABC-type molybdate transport system ATPase subunit
VVEHTLEVNWSRHSSDELAEGAQELITLSDGKIRTVVNVDLNEIYKASNQGQSLRPNQEGPAVATISV